MKKIFFTLILSFLVISCKDDTPKKENMVTTFCNPINLSYRFCLDEPSRREAADPTIVWFKDRYYLFASKSGGYWHSKDLIDWTLIKTNNIPVEDYAPTAITIGDTLYFLASSHELNTIYKSSDPLNANWSIAKKEIDIPVWDPAFFLDEDKHLYLYWGCSDKNPLFGVEIDYKNNFDFIGEPVDLKQQNPKEFGWEVPGDFNTLKTQKPWIEGAWVNKFDGKYYLQYSGPGTEFKSYSDGVYISDNPLGPFVPQDHNPFAYKPEGFAAGAGHGSTFTDSYGNLWHIGTITISQKHMFERRLGLYPTFIDKDGVLHSSTKYADFPMVIPKKKIKSVDDIFPGWMLLSYGRDVAVSSSIDSLPSVNITDEDIRTYWSAATGDAGENVSIDLEKEFDVKAVQINFAEEGTDLFGRTENKFHRYTVEVSKNAKDWEMIIDKSKNENDNSHDYTQLDKPVKCRYIKLTNVEVPSGKFAVSGFRVFGIGEGETPIKVSNFSAIRNSDDKREVSLTWQKSANAVGYNISYGVAKNKLYQNYIIYSDTTVSINSLNKNLDYYFTIEAFNENGITKIGKVFSVK